MKFIGASVLAMSMAVPSFGAGSAEVPSPISRKITLQNVAKFPSIAIEVAQGSPLVKFQYCPFADKPCVTVCHKTIQEMSKIEKKLEKRSVHNPRGLGHEVVLVGLGVLAMGEGVFLPFSRALAPVRIYFTGIVGGETVMQGSLAAGRVGMTAAPAAVAGGSIGLIGTVLAAEVAGQQELQAQIDNFTKVMTPLKEGGTASTTVKINEDVPVFAARLAESCSGVVGAGLLYQLPSVKVSPPSH